MGQSHHCCCYNGTECICECALSLRDLCMHVKYLHCLEDQLTCDRPSLVLQSKTLLLPSRANHVLTSQEDVGPTCMCLGRPKPIGLVRGVALTKHMHAC